MGSAPSALPFIPPIAANAPACVNPFNDTAIDECPGNSVCFPGNLPWIPKDSKYFSPDGIGFCSCFTVHAVEGDNCEVLMPYGYVQLLIALSVLFISVFGLIVTVADMYVFVRRVTKASVAYAQMIEAAEAAEAEHKRKHPNILSAPTSQNLNPAPLSLRNWLSTDPSFSLLITSSIVFALLIFMVVVDIYGMLTPTSLVLTGRYKTDPINPLVSVSFASTGVTNVSLILLGVAWIRMANKASKKNHSKQVLETIKEDSFMSLAQKRLLYALEVLLRVGLFLYPLIALILYVQNYQLVVFAISYGILFLMCFIFFAGSIWVRRLLARTADFLKSNSKQGDLPNRSARVADLLRMHALIKHVTIIIAIGIGFILASGCLFIVDATRTAIVRLPGRESSVWYYRLRIISGYLSFIGKTICTCATSWFGRKITRGVDLSFYYFCFCSFNEDDEEEHRTMLETIRRSFRFLKSNNKTSLSPPAAVCFVDDEEIKQSEHMTEEVEKFFFHDPARVVHRQHQFNFKVQEVAQPLTTTISGRDSFNHHQNNNRVHEEELKKENSFLNLV